MRTGQTILQTAARGGIKNITLELGGKNPMVVLPDADVAAAAAGAVAGMNFTSTAGQSCGSTSRLLVHRSLMGELVGRIEHARPDAARRRPARPEHRRWARWSARSTARPSPATCSAGSTEGLRMITGGQETDERGAYVAADRVRRRAR